MGEKNELIKLSWCEKILKVMEDGKWTSHLQIYNRIGLNLQDDRMLIKAINSYMRRLLMKGYVIRAHAPDVLNEGKFAKMHYVYKKTGKPYQIKTLYHTKVLLLGRQRRERNRKKPSD